MNNLLRLSSLLLLSLVTTPSSAQQNSIPGYQARSIAYPTGSAGKTTGAISRLVFIANSLCSNNNGPFAPRDTLSYSYTGDNAWDDLLQEWKYDQMNVSSGTYRFVQTFDGNSRVVRKEIQSKSASTGYGPFSAIVYSYHNNRLAEDQEERYVSAKWVPGKKRQYSYDGSGKIAEILYSDPSAGTTGKETFTYSADGLVLTEGSGLINGVWEPGWKEEFIYTGGKITEQKYSEHKNGAWTETARRYISYNNTDRIRTTYFLLLNNGNFDTGGRYVEHYDINNNLDTADYIRMKNGIDQPESRKITQYNAHNQPTQKDEQVWNSTTGAWEFRQGAKREQMYYFEFNLGVAERTDKHTKLSLYPVPAQNSLTIDVATQQLQPLIVNILHADGRVVRSWNQPASGRHYQETIDLSAISSGSYFISIHTAGGVVTRPFNIIR